MSGTYVCLYMHNLMGSYTLETNGFYTFSPLCPLRFHKPLSKHDVELSLDMDPRTAVNPSEPIVNPLRST